MITIKPNTLWKHQDVELTDNSDEDSRAPSSLSYKHEQNNS